MIARAVTPAVLYLVVVLVLFGFSARDAASSGGDEERIYCPALLS